MTSGKSRVNFRGRWKLFEYVGDGDEKACIVCAGILELIFHDYMEFTVRLVKMTGGWVLIYSSDKWALGRVEFSQIVVKCLLCINSQAQVKGY